jgi:hypothetical protein
VWEFRRVAGGIFFEFWVMVSIMPESLYLLMA